MAEAALISLASKVLTTMASPVFKKAYERALSVKKAREDLEDLRETVQTIQAILFYAEKQQEESIAVKNWIHRVRDALYDADDLFDEVVTDDLLKQQKGVLKKVWSPFSKLKTNDSIAKKVKDVRKCLDGISKDIAPFNFVRRELSTGIMSGVETGAFVNPDDVIGRDEDKEVIVDYIEDVMSYADRNISVIAVVGIGGMGKSTLAQLLYSDQKVSSGFKKSWWACINNISDKKQVTGKIFQSITGEPYHASWKLFKSLAYARGKENDPNWIELGKKIVKKCANVPLAIKSIASLLYTKTTLQEWLSFENDELSKLEFSQDSIIPALKLSYLHLSPNLKPCFAYCSLFPKSDELSKNELIDLWIAQGYVEPSNDEQTIEEAGHGYFMELVRRFFIQKAREDTDGEICTWKMHDLIHDLAQNVSGEENRLVTATTNQFGNKIRHLSIGCETDDSWNIHPSLFISSNQLRSFLFVSTDICSLRQLVVDQILTKFKFLRALILSCLDIEEVSCSIGELKHLRHLDLSVNKFTSLPDSITNLVNLITLKINDCEGLKLLPREFRKMVSLRQLDVSNCSGLRYMPAGVEELTCLQNLSCFKVGKAMGNGEISSRVDALAGLKLKGKLDIEFDSNVDDWNRDEWQLSPNISILKITNCPWMRIPDWWQRANVPSNLVKLYVDSSSTVKHLPPLRHLPSLRFLRLSGLSQLEYIEEDYDENESETAAASTTLLFFPCLESLVLRGMPEVKAWSRKVEAIAATSKGKTTPDGDHPHLLQRLPSLPVLSALNISDCAGLKCIPLLPFLHKLELHSISEELVLQLLSPYLEHLETLSICSCPLESFPGISFTSLRVLQFKDCKELKHLYLGLSQCDALKSLLLLDCPMLELWDEKNMSVDWKSFPSLQKLTLFGNHIYEKPARLPDCLQRLHHLGVLKIYIYSIEEGRFQSCEWEA